MRISVRRSHYGVTFAVLAVAVGSFALVQSMTIPVIAQIEAHFGTNQSTATWVLTAYLLSASVATPIIGRIGDAIGKERMLVAALAALSIGSFVAAVAPTIEVMIAARVIQGIGGGVLPLAFGIIRDEFPEHRIAGAVSLVSSLMAVGMGVGIVIAGPILVGLGYAWLFWLPCIVTALAMLATIVFVPESPVRKPGRISILPAVLLSSWLVCLLLAISRGPEIGWVSPIVLSLVALSALLAVGWVFSELRAKVPVVDMKMMRLRAVWTTNLVALLVGMGMYAAFGFIPQFNQTPVYVGYGFGATVTQSGLMMLPSAIATFITGVLAAPIAIRFGPKRVVICGAVVAALGMFMQALVHEEIWQLLVANAAIGFGVGLAFACLATLIVAAVPADSTGVATGMNANIRTLGGALGSAVMGSIVTSHVLPRGLPSEQGYTIGFAVLGGAFLLAAIAALAIPAVSGERLEHDLEAGSPEAAVAGGKGG